MKAKNIAEYLKGKTIKEIKWCPYLGWPMCVEEIIFTDGTTIEISGNANVAHIDFITLPDGKEESVE